MAQLFPIAAITDEFSPDIEKAVASIAEIGMTGAELRMLFGKNIIDLTDPELDRAKRVCADRGLQIISIAYALICLLMAYYVARWNRGVLPVAAGLAIIFGIVAVIAGPQWFYRDHAGYHNPGLPPSLLGLLTLIIVPVEFLLIVFAMRGFNQKWNIEVEITRDEYESGDWRRRDLTGEGSLEPRPG